MCSNAITNELATVSPDDLDATDLQLLGKLTGQTSGELLGGQKATCPGCPFNDGLTQAATEAQNYGCLPTAADIVQLKRRTGQNWACHDDETRICSGLCHAARPQGLDLSEGGLVRYSTWYQEGEQAAVDAARAETR